MIAAGRLGAYRALREVNDQRADSAHALEHHRRSLVDPRDRALVTEIVLGTLRWQGKLDHMIASLGRRPVSRLDPEILDVLRMSAFQLLHLDRVRPSAVVDDAVNLARRANKQSAAGFVNALLRRLLRESADVLLPPTPEVGALRASVLDYLSITMSHPRWLVERWLDRYGTAAAIAWAQFNNTTPPLTLRVNRLRRGSDELAATLLSHGVETEPARFAPDGLIVTKGNPLATPVASEGLFLVQDEASQLVALLPRLARGERVLDLCAAPGGKATAFAAAVGTDGMVVATDVRARRLDLLRATVTLAGAPGVRLARVDATRPLPFASRFGCVVLDAPCSGLGTIRRDPEIRWRRTADDLERLSAAQRLMLRNAASAVGEGGYLVYATCSSETEENDDVVAAFLLEHPTFERIRLLADDLTLPPGVRAVLDEAGNLRTFPHLHGLDAFFGCVIRRLN